MRVPVSTYRLQFTGAFGFNSANQIIEYLAELGISDLYASPIFTANQGSTHGYDVIDPNQINPELGLLEEFEALVSKVQDYQLGWLQDIVPNHMAYSSHNRLLMDVFEHGSASEYFEFFDIAWNAPFGDDRDRILAPMLGDFYGDCLERGEIQLQYDQGNLKVVYGSLKLPIRLESYRQLIHQNLESLTQKLGKENSSLIKLMGVLYIIETVSLAANQRQEQSNFAKGILWELYQNDPDIKEFLDQNIKVLNGEKGNSESFNALDELLREQFFRLAYWKTASESINYRRFFAVNELISIKAENLQTFEKSHAFISKLVQEHKFTGLRIDHIDGLSDPTQYLERLQERMGDVYITIEKILELKETLPDNWDIQGTSGYDFMNYVNGVFCKQDNQEALTKIYANIVGSEFDYSQLVREKKRFILEKDLRGDLANLSHLLKNISNRYRYSNDFTIYGLEAAIAEILILFPIYRTYVNHEGIREVDRDYIQDVIQGTRTNLPLLVHELNFIEKLLLLDYDNSLTPAEKEQWLYFVMRVQQYTGPLMAKGVEDTVLYVYNRLISLNEVGGNPSHFGVAVEDFHTFNQAHQSRWIHTMNATATHDTKRGEDTRARINVLSEIPAEWEQQVKAWVDINQSCKAQVDGLEMPDRNDEYFFYQTLVGAFPFDQTERSNLIDRLKEYIIKAIREAKVHTNWLTHNTEYETAFTRFVESVLDPSEQNKFLQKFVPFQQKIADYGIFNSLSQTLLKITAPGVPDFYQGVELWELSLVDPDNRRPVDFEQRRSLLKDLKLRAKTDLQALISELLDTRHDGRIKLFLTFQALQARKAHFEIFQQGDYLPLEITGKFKDYIIAFSRRYEERIAVTIVPRFLTDITKPGKPPIDSVWRDTYIQLPATSTSWKDAISGKTLESSERVAIAQILQQFPVALLVNAD
ncbi:malto-oligosyltrehalose synthase [Phormidesmis priestleyi]